jgi:hypothetical protein
LAGGCLFVVPAVAIAVAVAVGCLLSLLFFVFVLVLVLFFAYFLLVELRLSVADGVLNAGLGDGL